MCWSCPPAQRGSGASCSTPWRSASPSSPPTPGASPKSCPANGWFRSGMPRHLPGRSSAPWITLPPSPCPCDSPPVPWPAASWPCIARSSRLQGHDLRLRPGPQRGRTVGLVLWKVRQVFTAFPREYQLLVADDGSSDDTGVVLASYAKVLPLNVVTHRER